LVTEIVLSLVIADPPALALESFKSAHRAANLLYVEEPRTSHLSIKRRRDGRILTLGEFVEVDGRIGLIDHILRGCVEWVRVTYLEEISQLAAPCEDIQVLTLTAEVDFFLASADVQAVHVVHDCMSMQEPQAPCEHEERQRGQAVSNQVLADPFRGHNRAHSRFLRNPFFV
jgi:hypothetical protein